MILYYILIKFEYTINSYKILLCNITHYYKSTLFVYSSILRFDLFDTQEYELFQTCVILILTALHLIMKSFIYSYIHIIFILLYI